MLGLDTPVLPVTCIFDIAPSIARRQRKASGVGCVGADGTPLILFHCHGSANQSWTLTNGQIVGIGGSCVDVQGSTPIGGSPAILVHCDGAPSQRWNILNGNISGIGGKCLDVLEETGNDRTPIILAPCAGRPTEQWAAQWPARLHVRNA